MGKYSIVNVQEDGGMVWMQDFTGTIQEAQACADATAAVNSHGITVAVVPKIYGATPNYAVHYGAVPLYAIKYPGA